MKKSFYILAFIYFLGFNNLKAQSSVATLDHSGTTSVFYGANALVDAYNASVDGDAIILSSGSFNPPSTIQKGLKIIGVGHYPDSINGRTFINGNIILGLGANNILFEGIEVTNLSSNDTINNINIKRCRLDNGISFGQIVNNVIIEGSVLQYIDFNNNNNNNTIIRNNIILIFNSSVISNIQGGALIENNILYEQYSYNSIFNNVNNSIIKNNIIRKDYGQDQFYIIIGAGNIFQNNYIAYSGPYDGIPLSNIYNNNYSNTPWNMNSIIPNISSSFDYNIDYHILNPNQYLGTDGTQVGIYGGSNPYKENATPDNPRIVSKYIAPQNDSNGNLQINITAKPQY